ncbi:MAG: DUF4149 domain-containing protein [Gemmatimonadaceae bacterium]
MTRPLWASLLVALWLGAALLTVTVVAPGAFAVLPTRAMAGEMVGYVLPVVFYGAIAVPALVLVIDPGARRSGISLFASACSAVAALVALAVVNPRIAAIRVVAAVPIDQLSPDDPRRAMFGLLHAGSVALLGAAMLALLVLLISRTHATVRLAHPSGEAP